MKEAPVASAALDAGTVAGATLPAVLDVDAERDVALPADHPRWQHDIVSISARTRALLATVVPVALRMLSFWDHRVREIIVAGRRLSIDPAGSYRLR